MRRSAAVALTLLVTLVAEVVVFTVAVQVLGIAWTLLLVLATSLAGGWLLRREGMRGWRRFRAAVEQGRPPGGTPNPPSASQRPAPAGPPPGGPGQAAIEGEIVEPPP
jgi:FxsA cytoplasmic membrane protein